MKKTICSLYAVLAVMTVCVVVSCEKPIMSEEETSDMAGNLRVTVFEVEKVPFGDITRAEYSPASAVLGRLNFAVYNTDGTRVKQVNQTSDTENFGKASFQLEEGDYLLVVVGHNSGGNPTMADPTCVKFTNAQGYTDTFIFSGLVTIGEDAVDHKISLARITSMCQFVITDEEIPAEVKVMRFYYTGGSGAFDATTGLGCVNSKQDVKFDVTTGMKQFDLYTFLHDQEGTIHLIVTALDDDGNELYQRDFNVPMEQNYITRLTGAFFGGSGSSSVGITEVTVDTEWAGVKDLTF